MNRNQRRTRESGQVLVFFVLLIPILVGMVGMALDIGSYASDRRQLQNAADSIALAAGQQLPDAASSQTMATSYMNKNNIDPNRVSVSVTGGNSAPKVSVTITRPHNFAFLRALGVNSKNVSARAAAVKVSYGGGTGIVPWAVTEGALTAAGTGNLVTMKVGSDGANNGNFGPIRIDGNGANVYEAGVKFGTSTMACAATTPNCDEDTCEAGGVYPTDCAESAAACDGPECTLETGNIQQKSEQSVDYRIAYTISSCNTFDQAFPSVNGVRRLANGCNPWIDGDGKCDTPTELCSRRVIIIPVVDAVGNGASETTIVRFALMFLEGFDGNCNGHTCDIQGRIVTANTTMNGLAGIYDPTAAIQFVRLSE